MRLGSRITYGDVTANLPAHISALDLAAEVRAGRCSAREAAEHFIARVSAYDDAVRSIVWRDDQATIDAADAVDHARAAGDDLAPFAGVPITVKDTFSIVGQPNTMASLARDESPAEETDLLPAAAFGAGFIQLGRAASPELAMTTSCESERWGITRNPWSLEHSPGGSSGGPAAAVAAGLVPVALASDGGGSIRVPAAFCGVVGLKPSRGLLPQRIAGWEGGAVEGAVTRTIADTAAIYSALARPDAFGWSRSATQPDYTAILSQPLRPLRIGLVTTAFDPSIPVDPACGAAAREVADLLASRGHRVVEIDPIPAMAAVMDIYPRTIIPAWLTLTQLDHPERLQPYIQRTIELGRGIDATRYLAEANRFKLLARDIATYLFSDLDLVITPTTATRVPRIGVVWNELRAHAPSRECATYEQTLAFTTVPSVIGSPALTVPTHRDADGLPLGVQLVGPQLADGLLLQVGQLLETATAWTDRRPSVPERPAPTDRQPIT